MDLKQIFDFNSDPKETIEKFTIDLVKKATSEKLDPIIGRETEIHRLIQILSRKTKNNPLLIGEAGVGKTAIVEGLAQRIAKKDVPENLIDSKILELDMGALIAGAKFQGEFESRLKAIIEGVTKSNGKIILFIDEIHLIVGTGRTEGSMDASNLLKPYLARGELRCIGATTFDEYREYIEKDSALERRFQTIFVDKPTIVEAISILRGLKPGFETYHGVKIHDNAIVSAVKLSNQFIPARNLPDKAIDLIDEACALIKTQISSVPEELDKINRKVVQLEIEKSALTKEKDITSIRRLEKIKPILLKLKDNQKQLSQQWTKEKNFFQKIKNLKQKITISKRDLENCEHTGDFEKAGKLKYQVIPKLENELKKMNQAVPKNTLIKEDVTDNEIVRIVSRWTGIPVEKLVKSEQEKLLNLEKLLKEKVKGQPLAIQKVADSILRSRSGIKDPKKPIGSFLFLGSTGVGKTEVSKSLADLLFNSESNMIRLDMSEFAERHSVSKIIGAPPGYVGFQKGGFLTEAIKRRPYSIILFDEIEKAHSDVLNVLLQVLDEGFVTDNFGKKIDFRNTIIIMTSNVASSLSIMPDGLEKNKAFNRELNKYFKSELINRIDNVVLFNKLSKPAVFKIIEKKLSELTLRIEEAKNIHINFDESVKKETFKEGYSEEYGARPIARFISQNIETYIAKELLQNKLESNKNYICIFKNNEWCIKSAAQFN